MIKTSVTALLLSTALMTGAVVAQTSPSPTTDTSAPAMTTATTGTSASSATSGSAQFMTEQDRSQFRASKFVGLAIYGQDNQRIGDVNEILIDGTGNAKAIVIGVGGFLGIGEKSVAVPFSAVEWVNDRPVTTASNAAPATGAGTGSAMNTSPPASTGMGGGTAATRDASTTGSTAAAPARSPEETAAANGYPDHGKVKMSKADLQNAPAFTWYSEKK